MVYILLLFTSLSFGQYDFSLEDLNSSSEYFGNNVGPFSGEVSVVYFGHYN